MSVFDSKAYYIPERDPYEYTWIMNSTEAAGFLQWTLPYANGLQYSFQLIMRWFAYILVLINNNLSTHSQTHITLVTVFITIVFLSFTCYKKKKKGSNDVETTDSSIKMNWNVFDLAKSAYEPGHTDAVIKLVEKYDYDINYMMPASGLSLFLCSCLSGEKRLIKYFIDKGADVHVHTKEGDSPLYLATFGILNSPFIDVGVLTDLVKAGCGVNTQNSKGYTPLHRAAAKGDKEVIRCLIKLGADIYIHTKAGIYPMDSAINSGHLDAAELLKIKVDNPHVWDVVDPHTPPRIQLGFQSPVRKHLIESTKSHRPFHKVFTF